MERTAETMSLLWMEYSAEFQNAVEAAFECERRRNPAYFAALPKRVLDIVYRDTRYNIDFLRTAYELHDDAIMSHYAAWLYTLMDSVLDRRKILTDTTTYVLRHLDCVKEGVKAATEGVKQAELLRLLDVAQSSVEAAAKAPKKEKAPSRYEIEIAQYMDSLLQKNTRQALFLINQFREKGIPVADIYAEIITESMHRVGDLWHTAQISVDTEHYCTSTTQMAMEQLYPVVFEAEPKGRKVLCACPGSELHEMGARTVADLFESDGWESVYLGAGVPLDAMLHAVQENQPNLIVLSVTMQQHLIVCREMVQAIRESSPASRIAVGGGAFQNTNEIWKQWPIDLYTEDARELLRKANEELEMCEA